MRSTDDDEYEEGDDDEQEEEDDDDDDDEEEEKTKKKKRKKEAKANKKGKATALSDRKCVCIRTYVFVISHSVLVVCCLQRSQVEMRLRQYASPFTLHTIGPASCLLKGAWC